MASDTYTSTRDDTARETGTKADATERERSLDTRRDTAARRSQVTRRTPYLGATATPFSLMRRMAEDIERLFSDTDYGRGGYGLTSRPGYSAFEPYGNERAANATWAPQLETFRKDNNLVVRADLPGLTKDNVTIEVDDDVLFISGERADESRDERDDYYRSERTYGRFFRAIQLPEGIDTDKIDASFKDGVLEVTVPVPKVTTPKQRTVKIR